MPGWERTACRAKYERIQLEVIAFIIAFGHCVSAAIVATTTFLQTFEIVDMNYLQVDSMAGFSQIYPFLILPVLLGLAVISLNRNIGAYFLCVLALLMIDTVIAMLDRHTIFGDGAFLFMFRMLSFVITVVTLSTLIRFGTMAGYFRGIAR